VVTALAYFRQPVGAITITGTGECRVTLSATLPKAQRERPELPWVLIIIRSTWFFWA
jgi:hypothetical protein